MTLLRLVPVLAVCGFALACSSGGALLETSPKTQSGDAAGNDPADGGGVTTDPADGGSTPPTDVEVATLEFDPFDVAPGEEVYRCQNFANPFGGDADIQMFESDMVAGSHHLLLMYKDNLKDGPAAPCSGLEFDATPYWSQLQHDSFRNPDGIATVLPAGKGLRLSSHYLNTGTTTIHARVTVKLHRAVLGTVVHRAGIWFMNQLGINIPARTTKDVVGQATASSDRTILSATSHMHRHGIHFNATLGDQTIYQTDTWDNPDRLVFADPLTVRQGDKFVFTCTFKNDGDTTLTFGESALTGEMCIFSTQFYPIESMAKAILPMSN